MKEIGREPAFNIELSHAIRYLVMKRGYLSRGKRTRSLICTRKTETKSWLEVRLIDGTYPELSTDWDLAHDLAEHLQREFKAPVFVEPVSHALKLEQRIAKENAAPKPFDTGAGFAKHLELIKSISKLSTPPNPSSALTNSFLNRGQVHTGACRGDIPGLSAPFPHSLLDQTQRPIITRKTIFEGSATLLNLLANFATYADNRQRMLIAEFCEFAPLKSSEIEAEKALAELSVNPSLSVMLKRMLLENLSLALKPVLLPEAS
ncbi:MAG: hypothetical protein KGS72_23430 [Cyanobacteria bacterium REEB67]|nr:hypothetical protein [Cyanobacteria bacterium REEB67]